MGVILPNTVVTGPHLFWDDERVPITSVKLPTLNSPGFTQFKDNGAGSTGVFIYWFDPGTEEMAYFTLQMPHAWAEGTIIKPHVHWVPAANGAAGQDVCWAIEYTWCQLGEVFGNTAFAFGDTNAQGADPLVAGTHYLTSLTDISGAGKKLSSMLCCRIFRDATGTLGTDDYTDDAGLLEIDFHIQKDAWGSTALYTK